MFRHDTEVRMSSATPPPPATKVPPGTPCATKPQGTGYEVGRPAGKCAVTGEAIATGEKFMAALRETPAGFERLDISMPAWPQFDRKDVIGFWQTTMPAHEQKKKLFVDDTVLCDLFERLADTAEPSKLNFRF